VTGVMAEDSRLLFVAKGVGGFFVFLVPFLAVSTYFGGGFIGIGISIILAVTVAGGLLILWPRFHHEPQGDSKKATSSGNGGNHICRPGPYTVVSGTPTKIGLNVRAGDRIDGYVEEVDGDSFDWFIMDEENMVECLNGKDYDYLDGEENVRASKVDCDIPHDGPWYLMLDLGTRRYDRRVKVNLRVIRC
jgi:hypothetical protein